MFSQRQQYKQRSLMLKKFEWLWTLDPDQLKVLDLLQSTHHVIAPVHHHQKQDELMVAWAIEKLLAHQQVFLIIGDAEQQKRIYTAFQNLDLASIIYLKNQTYYLPALQLARKKAGDDLDMKSQQFSLATAQQEMKNWGSKYALLNQPVFESLTWRNLADRLASHPLSGIPNILQLKLDPTDFERNAEEYKMIRAKLSNYIKICKLNHPWFDQLEDLNISHLKQFSLDVIKKEVIEGFAKFTFDGEEIIRSGEILLLDFIKHSKQTLQNLLKESHQKIESLLFKIENYNKLLGPEFSLETSLNNFTIKLKSNFTRSSKDLIKARRLVKSAYMDTLTDLEVLESYLPPESLEPAHTVSMEAIKMHLQEISVQIKDCERKMQARINEQIKRLNSKNMSPEHPLRQSISSWEQQLGKWSNEISQAKFFNIQKEVNALSVQKKLNVVSDIVRQLREMKRASEKLEDFIFWKSFESNIPVQCRKVIAALEFEKHDRWLDLFDQWYFFSLLEQNALAEMPNGAETTDLPAQLAVSATKSLIQYLKLKTQTVRHQQLKSVEVWAKNAQSMIRKKDDLGLQLQIEQMGMEARTSLFPVQIVGPQSFTRTFGAECKIENVKVLYSLDQSTIEIGSQLASTTLQQACHVIAPPAVAQRMVQTSMSTRKNTFKVVQVKTGKLEYLKSIQSISNSEKLNYFKEIASLFEPFMDDLAIYNTRFVQIFSFLGPKLDSWILDEIELPYKIHNEGLAPNVGFIVECLLDHKKPIIMLTRDGLLSGNKHESAIWQTQVIEQLKQIGLAIHQSWSVEWMNQGKQTLEHLKDFIHHQIPNRQKTERSKSA